MLSCLSHFHRMYRTRPGDASRPIGEQHLCRVPPYQPAPQSNKDMQTWERMCWALLALFTMACKCCIIVTKSDQDDVCLEYLRALRNCTFVNCSFWACAQMRSRVVVLFWHLNQMRVRPETLQQQCPMLSYRQTLVFLWPSYQSHVERLGTISSLSALCIVQDSCGLDTISILASGL